MLGKITLKERERERGFDRTTGSSGRGGHMRCLLGWIGSDSADSDVKPLIVLDRFREFAEVGWGRLDFLSGNCVVRVSIWEWRRRGLLV